MADGILKCTTVQHFVQEVCKMTNQRTGKRLHKIYISCPIKIKSQALIRRQQ